jgi:hypothetical protein
LLSENIKTSVCVTESNVEVSGTAISIFLGVFNLVASSIEGSPVGDCPFTEIAVLAFGLCDEVNFDSILIIDSFRTGHLFPWHEVNFWHLLLIVIFELSKLVKFHTSCGTCQQGYNN